jgi:hypothetical protein
MEQPHDRNKRGRARAQPRHKPLHSGADTLGFGLGLTQRTSAVPYQSQTVGRQQRYSPPRHTRSP